MAKAHKYNFGKIMLAIWMFMILFFYIKLYLLPKFIEVMAR